MTDSIAAAASPDTLSDADRLVPVWRDDPRATPDSPAEQDYLFDLQGFTVLRGALSTDQCAAINGFVDAQDLDALEPGQWIGDVETHTYGSKDGINFQNIIEGGPVFEDCIDHPAWFERVKRYIARGHHQITIDENFLNVRRSGGFIPMHSGGDTVRFTSSFRNYCGEWMVGQINILMALTDVGYGDGCTTVIPGSHKAHEPHALNRD
ncbi:MAG: phytanoyl-CoA dioxygenase family protein, partial [Planctomycetota bacterium]